MKPHKKPLSANLGGRPSTTGPLVRLVAQSRGRSIRTVERWLAEGAPLADDAALDEWLGSRGYDCAPATGDAAELLKERIRNLKLKNDQLALAMELKRGRLEDREDVWQVWVATAEKIKGLLYQKFTNEFPSVWTLEPGRNAEIARRAVDEVLDLMQLQPPPPPAEKGTE